eukprot:GHVL01022448.1.p1 GENE.GHVL01022448.1~~GHVL01022448.1.p1  ORF type:complete len:765 (+),score=97.80 GHVL01022448.1:152-2446(+)
MDSMEPSKTKPLLRAPKVLHWADICNEISGNTESLNNNWKLSDIEPVVRCKEGEQKTQPLLGQGSFGMVFKVIHAPTDEVFAMKVIDKRALKQREKCPINLEREIKLQYETNHPNVVRLVDHFENENHILMLLELCEGGSLWSFMRSYKGKLSEFKSKVLFLDVCRGLSHLHSLKILHRDLKPENLLLNEDEILKIADFGWSARVRNWNAAEQGGDSHSGKPSMARNTFCGTLDYVAPEMLRGEKQSEALDVWSLGILLHEMLTGRAPFTGKNHVDFVNNVLAAKLKRPANIGDDGWSLLRSLLKTNPRNRLTIPEILRHPWLNGAERYRPSPNAIPSIPREIVPTVPINNPRPRNVNSTVSTEVKPSDKSHTGSPSSSRSGSAYSGRSAPIEQQRSHRSNKSKNDQVFMSQTDPGRYTKMKIKLSPAILTDSDTMASQSRPSHKVSSSLPCTPTKAVGAINIRDNPKGVATEKYNSRRSSSRAPSAYPVSPGAYPASPPISQRGERAYSKETDISLESNSTVKLTRRGPSDAKTQDSGRRTPESGRRTPESGRRTPESGRRTTESTRGTTESGRRTTESTRTGIPSIRNQASSDSDSDKSNKSQGGFIGMVKDFIGSVSAAVTNTQAPPKKSRECISQPTVSYIPSRRRESDRCMCNENVVRVRQGSCQHPYGMQTTPWITQYDYQRAGNVARTNTMTPQRVAQRYPYGHMQSAQNVSNSNLHPYVMNRSPADHRAYPQMHYYQTYCVPQGILGVIFFIVSYN